MLRIIFAVLLTMAILQPARAGECRRGEVSYMGADKKQHTFAVVSCGADAEAVTAPAGGCNGADPSSLLRCGVKLPDPMPSGQVNIRAIPPS